MKTTKVNFLFFDFQGVEMYYDNRSGSLTLKTMVTPVIKHFK